jgi:hypothetical protein
MLGLVAAPPAPSSTRAKNLAIPVAASLSLVLWSSPGTVPVRQHFQPQCSRCSTFVFLVAVNAGILSGFSGLESVPGPDLPRVEFLEKWNG